MSERPGNQEEELLAGDEQAVARGLKVSGVILLVLAVLGGGVWWWINREDEPEHVEEGPFVPPRSEPRDATPPTVRFTDVTASSGLDYVHVNGALGDKLLPETMGGGCAFLDHDGDGDQDILFVSGVHYAGSVGAENQKPAVRLYENDGKGNFRDIGIEAGFREVLYGMGCACGDYDGDGDVDVYVTGVGKSRLYRNDGGRFTDVTSKAGVAGKQGDWGTSAAFFDYDNDGDLDLFCCNYVRWSRDIDFKVDYRLTGLGRAYGPPTHYGGAHCYLYRNDGEDRFADVSEAAGLHVLNQATGKPEGKALALAPVDVDGDGWMDVMVANDTVRNFLFHNQKNGTFKEVGGESGVGFDNEGKATGAMGIDAAWHRDADTLAFGVGNFANEMSSFYVHQGIGMQFADEAITEGIGPTTRLMLSFGLFFFDYDLDGRLDLVQTNGHLEEEINKVQQSQHYRQPSQLFWNAGEEASRCYVPVPADSTGDFVRPIVGRGAAFADIDGDGDLDVLFTQVADRPLLLRNDQATGHHWLRVRLKDKGKNPEAIGARVEWVLGGKRHRAQVMPTRSYLSQVELPITIGLGEATALEELTVVWPDGTRQKVEVPGVDRELAVVRDA